MNNIELTNPPYQKILAEFEFDRKLKCRPSAAFVAVSQIREFLWFLETKNILDLRKVTYGLVNVDYVKGYLITRLNRYKTGPLSSKTVSQHVTTIGKFNDYLLQQKYVNQNWGRYKFGNLNYNERDVLTLSEVNELFEACKTVREKALLAVAYGCGLRRSEIAHLNINDVVFREGIIVVRQGKFMKRREVVMSDKTQVFLQEYASGERLKSLSNKRLTEPGFFLTCHGKRISGSCIYYVFKTIVKRTGNKEILKKKTCLHTLRHACATHMYQNGASWEFIESFLGHSTPDSSYRYFKKKRQIRIQNKKMAAYG